MLQITCLSMTNSMIGHQQTSSKMPFQNCSRAANTIWQITKQESLIPHQSNNSKSTPQTCMSITACWPKIDHTSAQTTHEVKKRSLLHEGMEQGADTCQGQHCLGKMKRTETFTGAAHQAAVPIHKAGIYWCWHAAEGPVGGVDSVPDDQPCSIGIAKSKSSGRKKQINARLSNQQGNIDLMAFNCFARLRKNEYKSKSLLS